VGVGIDAGGPQHDVNVPARHDLRQRGGDGLLGYGTSEELDSAGGHGLTKHVA